MYFERSKRIISLNKDVKPYLIFYPLFVFMLTRTTKCAVTVSLNNLWEIQFRFLGSIQCTGYDTGLEEEEEQIGRIWLNTPWSKFFLTMNHINKYIIHYRHITHKTNISWNSMSLLASTGCNSSNLNLWSFYETWSAVRKILP